MLSIFSCTCWSFICTLWKNDYLIYRVFHQYCLFTCVTANVLELSCWIIATLRRSWASLSHFYFNKNDSSNPPKKVHLYLDLMPTFNRITFLFFIFFSSFFFFFFCYWHGFFIYFGILAPYQIYDLQILSPIQYMLPFSFADGPFTGQKLFSLTFYCLCFWCHSQKSLWRLMSRGLLPVFFYRFYLWSYIQVFNPFLINFCL